MLADLGRRIFRYLLVFSIVHLMMLILLMMARVNIPSDFYIVPPIHYEKLQEMAEKSNTTRIGIDFLVFGVFTAAWGVINFLLMLIGGIGIFFTKMSFIIMKINPILQPLAVALVAFGGVLQFSVYAYYLQVLLKYFRGYGE
ncbi:MAG: hypothetical protein QXX12_00710 [Nanopusillaceae archaeon]